VKPETVDTDHPIHPGTRNIVWGLIVAGLILRLVAVPVLHRNGYTSDEGEYLYIAGRIAEGRGFMDSNGTESVRAPLYPSLLAALRMIPVQQANLAHIVNVLLGTCTIALVYALSVCVWSDRKIAVLAAGFAAFHPALVVYSAMLLTEPLYVTLFILSLVLTYGLIEVPRIRTALFLGAVAGLASLTKAVFLPFFLVMMGGHSVSRRLSRPGLLAAAALSACALVICPWTVRNYQLHGSLVPISTFAGPSFLLGNNPFSHGTTRLDPGFDAWLDGQILDRTGIGMNQTPEPEWARLSFAIGWEYVSENPARWAELLLRKTFVYLVYPATYSDSDTPARAIAMAGDAALWVLVCFGVVLGGAGIRRGWVLVLPFAFFAIAHVSMHAEARYRLPLVPLLCIIGAGGAAILIRGKWWRSLRSGRKISLLVLVSLVIALYGLTGVLFLVGQL